MLLEMNWLSMRLVKNGKATATPSSFNCSQKDKNGNECPCKILVSNKRFARPTDTTLECHDSKVGVQFEVHTKANSAGKSGCSRECQFLESDTCP